VPKRPATRRSYDRVKVAGRRRYTGMAVGRSHHWDYPDGVWVEKKVSPDQWSIRFTSLKRRKGGGAPAGSGAPVGTEYHWFILAHQRARKLDANTYQTDLQGAKHMVAFRQPGWSRWSAQLRGHKSQRQRLERILEAALEAVRRSPEIPEGEDLVAVPGMEGSAVAARGKAARHPASTQRRPPRPKARGRRGAARGLRPVAAAPQ
jgi:hypothetical protein